MNKQEILNNLNVRIENGQVHYVGDDQQIIFTETLEAYSHKNRQTIIGNLIKSPDYYNSFLEEFFKSTGQDIKVDEKVVRKFFSLPEKSPMVRITKSRSGSVGFDYTIFTTQNPELQETAMNILDKVIAKFEVITDFNWNVSLGTGISYKHIAAFTGEQIYTEWVKVCRAAFNKGKNKFLVEG